MKMWTTSLLLVAGIALVAAQEPRACKVGSARDCPLGQYCKVVEGACPKSKYPATQGTCTTKPLVCDEHTLPQFTQVCGCDGTTYRTECHAEKAGVSVLYKGACFSREAAAAAAGSKACGGQKADACAASDFCAFEVGVCGMYNAQGTCEPKPEWENCNNDGEDLVCGCNGITYSNPCSAKSVGVSIKSLGECPISTTVARPESDQEQADTDASSTGTIDFYTVTTTGWCGAYIGGNCPEGYFCKREGEACHLMGGGGRCAPWPTKCTPSVDSRPVCDCTGNTYATACDAVLASSSVYAPGSCPVKGPTPVYSGGSLQEPRACKVGNARDCPVGQYCKVPDGGCSPENAMTEGTCAAKPATCEEYGVPHMTQVCGCDGRTYRTECLAAKAGVSVLYQGACFSREAALAAAGPKACGGTKGTACASASDYCAFEVGVCGMYDAQGACEPKAEVCNDSVDPVCGCDDKTYSNACEAKRAGVSIKSLGKCPIFTDDGQSEENQDQADTTDVSSGSFDASAGSICGPFPGGLCIDGYYCKREGEAINNVGGGGRCAPRPTSCTPSVDSHPVCGSDDRTYATECDAAMAAVSVQAHVTCLEMNGNNPVPVVGHSPAPAAASSASRSVVLVAALAAAAVALAL